MGSGGSKEAITMPARARWAHRRGSGRMQWHLAPQNQKVEVHRKEQRKVQGLQVPRLAVTLVCLALAMEAKTWAEEHWLHSTRIQFYPQCRGERQPSSPGEFQVGEGLS